MAGALISFPTAVREIAGYSANPLVIDALITLSDENLRYILATNPNLSLQQTHRLLQGANVTIAALLASRAKGDETLRLLLQDPRTTVRRAIFKSGLVEASTGLMEELIPTLTSDDARRWLASGKLPPEYLTRQIATRAPAYQTIELFYRTDIYSEDEIRQTLRTIRTHSISALAELLDSKPQLLPLITELAQSATKDSRITKYTLLNVLSLSRHLFGEQTFTTLIKQIRTLSLSERRYTLYALYKNPNLPLHMVAEIAELLLKSTSRRVAYHGELAQKHFYFRQGVSTEEIQGDWQQILNGPDTPAKFLINHYLSSVSVTTYPSLAPTPPAAPLSEKYSTQHPKESMSEFAVERLNIFPPATPHAAQNHSITYEPMTKSLFQEQVTPLIDPLGKSGWELFFNLALSWKSNIQDLIDTTLTAHSS